MRIVVFLSAAMIAAMSANAANAGSDRPLVVFADVRNSESVKGIAFPSNAAVKAGCDVEVRSVKGEDWESGKLLEGADVVVFTGGMNNSTGPLGKAKGRLALMRFIASGKGVLLAGFRSGPVRTGIRPLCGDIASTYGGHPLTPWLTPVGDSPIAKAFGGETLFTAGFDCLGLRLGPDGTPFAKCGDEIVGAFGPVGLGRAVVLGTFVSARRNEVRSPDRVEAVFVEIFKYLSSMPAVDDATRAKAVADAERKLRRRETVYDFTHDEQGPSRRQGDIPASRDHFLIPVESRQLLLEHYARTLDDKGLSGKCVEIAAGAKAVVAEIRRAADERIKGLDFDALAESAQLRDKTNAAASNEFAAIAAKCDIAAMDALAAKCRAKAKAERFVRVEIEHQRDLATLLHHVSRLSSADAAVRLDAAVELGRIGERPPEVVSALVKAIDDPDEKVRIQAVTSLAWMRASKAVPALLEKMAQPSDERILRRIVQALGQIGNEMAIPALLPFLSSRDRWLRENAILSLGWLKAKEAVPTLVKYAKGEDVPEHDGRFGRDVRSTVYNTRECAIRALGAIGDKSAIPALKEIAAKEKPEKTFTLSSCRGRGVSRLASEAVADIERGGQESRGVVQPPELRSREFFYALSKGDNLLAGRHSWTGELHPSFKNPKDRRFMLPYLLDAGFTGIHEAWGVRQQPDEDYLEFLDELDELGLICVQPAFSGIFTNSMRDLAKGTHDWEFSHVGRHPLYLGCWSEEDWPHTTAEADELEAWLKRKYGEDYAAKLGFAEGQSPHSFKMWAPLARQAINNKNIGSISAIDGTSSGEEALKDQNVYDPGANSGALRVAALEMLGEDLEERLIEVQGWLYMRRKAFDFTYSVSAGDQQAVINGQKAMSKVGIPGPEHYQACGLGNVWLMEKYRNGATRPVMTEFYSMYSHSLPHDLVGYWENVIHGKCFFTFDISHMVPFFGHFLTWGWNKARWNLLREVYGHVRDNRELYEVSPSAAKVAVLVSERSFSSFRRQGWWQASQFESLDQRGCAVFTALMQSHVQSDVIDIGVADAEKLSKYSVLFLSDAKVLTDGEQSMLADWVRAGGTLVCDGATGLFDAKNLKENSDLSIAGLLGVKYVKTDFLEGHKVWILRPDRYRRPYQIQPALDNYWNFQCAIYRDFRDEDAVAVASDGANGKVEYDAALGISRIELNGAKAVQTFADGSPALTVNEYGRGRAFFFAPHAPMLGYKASNYESNPNRLDFWTGVRETYEKLARDGMARSGKAQPVDAIGLPLEVEMVVYEQEGRLVVHILDRSETGRDVTGASLRINGDRPIKAVYRPGGKPLAITDRTVALDKFNVYDMVVVEFE